MSEITIKCPTCGKILRLHDSPTINTASFTCPVCKEKHIVRNCQRVVKSQPKQSAISEETQYGYSQPTRNSEETQYGPALSHMGGGEETQIASAPVQIGNLIDNDNGTRYQLQLGANIVGRKAATSPATIQIVDNSGYMSRNHASIEVRNAGGKLLHIFKNTKNQNSSYINDVLVQNGDQLILNDGDRLKLGEKKLTFKL